MICVRVLTFTNQNNSTVLISYDWPLFTHCENTLSTLKYKQLYCGITSVWLGFCVIVGYGAYPGNNWLWRSFSKKGKWGLYLVSVFPIAYACILKKFFLLDYKSEMIGFIFR